MIGFFRKIRKKLADDNQFLKYSRYAVGEILLVVIGILIALQVNSCNQQRLDRIEEKTILVNLHNEFLENRSRIRDMMELLKKARQANNTLIQLIGLSREELETYNLDSIFYESLPAAQFSTSEQSIQNIIQGGKMNIVRNDQILNNIYQWQAQKEAIIQRERATDDWSDEKMLPILIKYISLKEMDSYGGFRWSGKSKLKPDYYQLFQLLEFENILDNFLYLHLKQYEEIEKAGAIADSIIELTKPYKK